MFLNLSLDNIDVRRLMSEDKISYCLTSKCIIIAITKNTF